MSSCQREIPIHAIKTVEQVQVGMAAIDFGSLTSKEMQRADEMLGQIRQ